MKTARRVALPVVGTALAIVREDKKKQKRLVGKRGSKDFYTLSADKSVRVAVRGTRKQSGNPAKKKSSQSRTFPHIIRGPNGASPR
jgi:hypothetical protein